MTQRRAFTVGINALLWKVRAVCAVCEETVELEAGFNAVATSGPGTHSGHSCLHDSCAERHRAGISEQLAKLRQSWPDGEYAEFLMELLLEGAEDVMVGREAYGEVLDFVHLVFGQASRLLFDGDEDYEPDDEEEEPPDPHPTPATLRSGQIEKEVREEENQYDRSQRG